MCYTVQQYDIQFYVHTAASTLTAIKILVSSQNLAIYQQHYITRLCAICVWNLTNGTLVVLLV